MDNTPGFIDSHDLVVRVNNYKLIGEATGARADVYYSFFGNSIHKAAPELQRDGVRLCMCKCPNALAIDSDWHRVNNKMIGVDFRWIYERRRAWWFCDTYIPELWDFSWKFKLLGNHVPTTGFSAILDIFSIGAAHVHITGFDFFRSGVHNVNEGWKQKNNDDPIGHVPERELAWLRTNWKKLPVSGDARLMKALAEER